VAGGRQPPRRADGSEFHPQAEAWWHEWARGPDASSFRPWHWQRLEMGTLLVDRFYAAPSAALSAEIRAVEKQLAHPERDAAGWIRLHG
jgi:hypothetical protein